VHDALGTGDVWAQKKLYLRQAPGPASAHAGITQHPPNQPTTGQSVQHAHAPPRHKKHAVAQAGRGRMQEGRDTQRASNRRASLLPLLLHYPGLSNICTPPPSQTHRSKLLRLKTAPYVAGRRSSCYPAVPTDCANRGRPVYTSAGANEAVAGRRQQRAVRRPEARHAAGVGSAAAPLACQWRLTVGQVGVCGGDEGGDAVHLLGQHDARGEA